MKTLITFTLSIMLFALPVAADESEKAPMERLQMLVGEWSGSGSIRMGPGEPEQFDSTETVEARVDGKALVVEGRHTNHDGVVVHHALGVFTWDASAGKYRFQTYVAGRGVGTYDAWFEGDDLIWEIDAGERKIRYVIELSDTTWRETGTMTMNGKSYPFFEMTLTRAD